MNLQIACNNCWQIKNEACYVIGLFMHQESSVQDLYFLSSGNKVVDEWN
jgi:hypothetical protein